MSRVIERRFLLGDVEKHVFRKIMRGCEVFCGVRIVTYALMSNHFHILVHVPEHRDISDAELGRRLEALYTKAKTGEIMGELLRLRAEARNKEAEELKASFTYRMEDVSEFFKTLKQRFTQWYNRKNNRRGTLWEERFKSVLVEGQGNVLATMAAYIDLNPVRAGLVEDPKDYRFCGYGEAVAGVISARDGLAMVTDSLGQGTEWRSAGRAYRMYLHARGEARESKPGMTRDRVQSVLAEGGKISTHDLLRCRVRYFSDGVALGSRKFVEEIFQMHRQNFGPKRTTGARPIRGADLGDMFTARDLRLDAIGLPKES
ncbi:MAG TPA: chemotaxis protein CheW [Kiritimatiellia bacterium]|nr:chemotaxis protein CheW [Kiritimatiellia bacterium]